MLESILFWGIGGVLLLLGIRDLWILSRCTERIEAEHTGYRTYYGGGRYGIRKINIPVFTYTYQGIVYQSQLAQNVSYKKLTEHMEHGNIHPIYINPRHPQTCIFLCRVRLNTILFLCLGLLIILGEIMKSL